jgi:hypothetical protein
MSGCELIDSQTYYQKMTAEGQARLLDGEEAIWGVAPYDSTSEYQQLDSVFFEARGDIPPSLMRWLFSRIVASYDPEKHAMGQAVLDQTIETFKKTIGDPIKQIKKEGAHLLVNVDHQSRFSPLFASLLLQYAGADTDEELVGMRSICSTIFSRYLGFYELKLGQIVGDPSLPNRPALDIARNVCGLIPVFPNTDIRESCGVDIAQQRDTNRRVMSLVRPQRGAAHIRTLVASAALDAQCHITGTRMRTIADGTKSSVVADGWDYTLAVATHIDPDPARSFFIASDIEAGVDRSTLDRQNDWIARERSRRSGNPVKYEARVSN